MPYSSWMRNESPLLSLLPRQKVAALRKQAPLGAPHQCRLQCIAARSRWVHQATRCWGQAGLGQLRGKQTAAPSGRQREGSQPPRTSWNKIIRFRLGMPTRFSYVDPAGTPVVPSRDCKTLHRVDRSRCCKIGIALIPNLICKVRERIWILKLPLCYHPIHL